MQQTVVIVLAAGQGTRLGLTTPKPFVPIAGKPMVYYGIEAGITVDPHCVITVLHPSMQPYAKQMQEVFPKVQLAWQETAQGTAHAVSAALPFLTDYPDDTAVLIIYADTPLLTAETVKQLRTELIHHPFVVLGFYPPTPIMPYGRIILDAEEKTKAIIEYAEASPEERATALCNAGAMGFHLGVLKGLLSFVKPHNHKQEYYLTDIIALGHHAGYKGATHITYHPEEAQGINTQADLAVVEKQMQHRLRQFHLSQGVVLRDPDTVWLQHDTRLSPGVVIHPMVWLGLGVTVESHVEIHSFSHIEGTYIESGAMIGPFARTRPHTFLRKEAQVGNFVELKNTQVGEKTKIRHMAYLGDTTVGKAVNIGAGTITCNFDGKQKNHTVIKEGAFIGANNTLIAPLVVGSNAYTGGGSVISHNVPEAHLAISRASQKNIDKKPRS